MSYWINLLKSEYPQKVKGKVLDQIAYKFGFERKRYYWIFKESDKAFRKRIINHIKGIDEEMKVLLKKKGMTNGYGST